MCSRRIEHTRANVLAHTRACAHAAHRNIQMDTIGDAYIVVGFLPYGGGRGGASDDEGRPTGAQARRVCAALLAAAREILAAVSACRREDGSEVQCRIGAAAGPVLAGVLGTLQPRFHVFGEVVRARTRACKHAWWRVLRSECTFRGAADSVCSCTHPLPNSLAQSVFLSFLSAILSLAPSLPPSSLPLRCLSASYVCLYISISGINVCMYIHLILG